MSRGGFVAAPVDVGASGLVFGDRAFDDARADARSPVGKQVVQHAAADYPPPSPQHLFGSPGFGRYHAELITLKRRGVRAESGERAVGGGSETKMRDDTRCRFRLWPACRAPIAAGRPGILYQRRARMPRPRPRPQMTSAARSFSIRR